ncbi:MAG: ATP-grasp domain-containing protein [Ignavibacterium sp.]|nr:ATP-grasp domain-containing protein [Ignavibacterium sp.]MCX7612134.1 ATP-grasp domain-containing protein [Ignavibacterium sp.]MDW8375115.1 ATP-grasp domain-containing protein [Ignavibacteriales bacterium]
MKIAVTGLNATDNPGPGVPVIRSLYYSKDFAGEIIGLIYDALEPGIYMDNITKRNYLIPYPSSGLQNLYERLVYIQQQEKIDVIIPTLDSELFGFVKLEDKLKKLGIKMFLPTFEQLNIRAKDKLFDFCKGNEINVPKNILVSSLIDLMKIPEEFEYPVVVKGIFYDAYIVNNFEEAKTAFLKISSKWGLPIIIQEFLKGDEFNVVALGDGSGQTVGAVAMRKLYITEKGKGWAGVTIFDNNLIEISKKVIEKIKWRSGMELEFIKSSETGQYYLLEINPRFPAWVYLAPNAGQNLPYALLQLALGNNVEKFDNYKVGTIFVRSSWDLITDISTLEKISTQGEI